MLCGDWHSVMAKARLCGAQAGLLEGGTLFLLWMLLLLACALAGYRLGLRQRRRSDSKGKAPAVHAPSATRRREQVETAIATALVRQQGLHLNYQPIHDMQGGTLAGFEALIRLDDPVLGSLAPSEFIPVAEQSGLIARLGDWALEEACRAASGWPGHLIVAVNLSPAQFLSMSLTGTIQRTLATQGLCPSRLEVEITEGTLMRESELVLRQLRQLREMGVGVALDDFGTGYSSLAYLWKFPFSKLKIDRSFTGALEQSAPARNILRSIVELGHGLGMTVTAEGIETHRQFSSLRAIGCDLAQGYLLGRPAREADLAAVILRDFLKGLPRHGATGNVPRCSSNG